MKYSKVIFLFLFSLPFHVNGQISREISAINADSLEQIISALSGTEKVDTLNSIAYRLMNDFPEISRDYASLAIGISDSLNYLKGLADGYGYRGNSYIFFDSLSLAMINFLNAVKIYEQIDPSYEQARVYILLSWINYYTGRFQSVINYGKKAIKLCKQMDTIEKIGNRYNLTARAFMELEEYDSAMFYKIAFSYADTPINSWYYNTFGRIYLRKFRESNDTSMLETAIGWFLKGMNSVEITDYQIAGINANLFYCYFVFEKKESDSMAMYHLKQVLPSALKNKKTFYPIPTYWLMSGELLRRYENFDSAIICFSNSLKLADSALSNFSMKGHSSSTTVLLDRYWLKRKKSEACYLLYDTYTILGDYKKALEYYVEYRNAKDDIYQEETKNLVAMLEAESESEKIENQMARLERDKKINELKAKQTRNLNIGIIIAFVVLLLVGVLFLRQNKLKNEHKSTLLEQKLLRLQMNPHFIFNALSNILNFIDKKENHKASTYLTTFSKLLRSTLESTREEMVPFEQEVGSLKNYLELQKLRYKDKFEYTVQIDENIDEEEMSIPPMLVQPFIENAIEHGIRHKKTPGRIDVRFNLDGKKILCEVEDDGVGRGNAWEAGIKEKVGHKSMATGIIQDRLMVLSRKFRQKIRLVIVDKASGDPESSGTRVLLDLPVEY